MKSWPEFKNNKMNEALTPKICYIMRGISGSGKSTAVRDILAKHGVNAKGHVFSTDDFFIPVTYKLRHLGHPTPENMPIEKAIEICQELMEMWYGSKYSPNKGEGQPAFLEVKKLIDKGEYHAAIQAAQNMIDILDIVEYRSKWDGGRLHKAHINNHINFKLAVDQGVTPIIIDNTNVTLRDCKSYAEYAQKAEYEIKIQEPTSPHWLANRNLLADKYGNKEKIAVFAQDLANKNKHGVPLASIENMINKWHHNLTVKDLSDKD